MKAIEITSKSLLRKQKRPDSWFLTKYGMNIYRGCAHNCVYCDGFSEKYFVNDAFESNIEAKINAPELLKGTDKVSKKTEKTRVYWIAGWCCLMPTNLWKKIIGITRKILEILEANRYPVMILTKSQLIERDIDLLKKINEKTNALVGMSFSSVNDEVSSIFESGIAPPSKRLQTLQKIKAAGIKCGIFLMPMIPFITDTLPEMSKVFQNAHQLNLDL